MLVPGINRRPHSNANKAATVPESPKPYRKKASQFNEDLAMTDHKYILVIIPQTSLNHAP